MTPEQLAAIRARLDAATPGPWIAEYSGDQGNCVIPHDALSTREAVCVTRLYHAAADAEFIAHARTDLETLLAEVEHLTQMIRDIDEAAQPKTWKSDSWSVDGRTLWRILHPPLEPAPRESQPLDTGDWTPDRIWTEETP